MTIIVISLATDANSLSGGDRIYIELSKRRIQNGDSISIITNTNGKKLCMDQGLNKVSFKVLGNEKIVNFRFFFVAYLYRTLCGTVHVIKNFKNYKFDVVYSSSDFWPDTIPAFLLKKMNKNFHWVAGFYLFAPKPWSKISPYKGKNFVRGVFYYLTQLPIYWLVRRYSDIVFVTSEPDVEKFITKKRGKNRIVVIRGGVDIKPSEEYLKSGDVVSVEKRKYDACFVGRFHYQKGVLELIAIWKLVCKEKFDAKLSMIGIGSLEKEIREKIERLELENNIELLGFKDGDEKYEIFKKSKIIVHPATYDSGGMAACEAMAWGLPGISFDLDALKTYYPKGMLKTPCYDLNKFAENIIRLLEDKKLYLQMQKEAVDWAREWDWDKRAEDILRQVRVYAYD